MSDILWQTFDAIQKTDINFRLLRLDELDQMQSSREVDLWTAPQDLAHLSNVLIERGFVPLPSWGYAPHQFFVKYDSDSGEWFKLDVVTELAYGRPYRTLLLGDAGNLLLRSSEVPTYRLADEDEFLTLLLHCLLDKRKFVPTRADQLSRLWQRIVRDQKICRSLQERVERLFSSSLPWQLLQQVAAEREWEALLRQSSAVARRLFWRDPIGCLRRELRVRLMKRLRPLFMALRSPGITVALLAPDGAGKSTLAHALAKEPILHGHIVYLGTNVNAEHARQLPATRWLHQRRHEMNGKDSPARRVLSGVSFCNRLLEQRYRLLLAAYHRLRGRTVIFDRYVYDSWLAARPATPWKRLRRWLLEAGWPNPDLVILLDAPGEVLYSRKGEHSPEWLEQQRHGYLRLALRVPQMKIIAASAEAMAVRREVISLIWECYWNRARRFFPKTKIIMDSHNLTRLEVAEFE